MGRRASDAATTATGHEGPPQPVGVLLACNQSVDGHEEFPYSHNCVIPYSLLDPYTWTAYDRTVCGFVHPAVVTATMITNCLVCAVSRGGRVMFSRKNENMLIFGNRLDCLLRRRRSSVKFEGGARHFCPKIMYEKLTKCPKII